MTTLVNGVKIDTTTYRSTAYTPRNRVQSIFGQPRTITNIAIHWYDRPENKPTFESTCKYLTRPGANTSAHYVLEGGRVAQLVHPEHAAWHSGSAYGNATSISIECNPRMTSEDLDTLVALIVYLEGIYGNLTIYGHKDFSATECPGVYYPKIQEVVDRVNAVKAGTLTLPGATPATAPAQPVTATAAVMPVEGHRVSQAFGAGRTMATNLGGGHTGVDWATPVGTPVKAVADGVVLWEDWASKLPTTSWEARWYLVGGGFGNLTTDAGITVVIDHGDYLSISTHLNETPLVKGQRVKAGEIIGKTGNTGYTTGPHLHFEVLPKPFAWSNGFYGRVEPIGYLKDQAAKKSATTATPAPAKAVAGTVRPYWLVKAGDTLSGIVYHYYKTTNAGIIRMVANYNGISDPATISVGQKVYIPARTWTVQSGDTWESVARTLGFDVGYFQKLNAGKSMAVGTTLTIW